MNAAIQWKTLVQRMIISQVCKICSFHFCGHRTVRFLCVLITFLVYYNIAENKLNHITY